MLKENFTNLHSENFVEFKALIKLTELKIHM
jgi:hypothetical protein